jgi:hypothetical protein
MNNTNEKILKSLADLEHNLNQINSAKEQVNKVVQTSVDLAKVIESYQSSFQGLSNNVKTILEDSSKYSVESITKLSEQVDNFKAEVENLSKIDVANSIEKIEKEVVLKFEKNLNKQLSVLDLKSQEFQNKIDEFKSQISRIESMKLDFVINETSKNIIENIKSFELKINNEIGKIYDLENSIIQKIEKQNSKAKGFYFLFFILIVLVVFSILVPLKLKKII